MARLLRHGLIPALLVIGLALFSSLAVEKPSEPDSCTGLDATISEGPIYGGPSNRGEPETRPLANTEFEIKDVDDEATSIQTDDQGHFRISLAPGHYSVSRQSAEFSCSFEVDLVVGQMKKMEWTCDTGMR